MAEPEDPVARDPAQGGGAGRVLLVEDQWLIAMDIAGQLEDGGYEIVGPASTLQNALALIEKERIDVGLLDVDLGGELSYPAAAAMNARGIAFAFLSGNTSAELDPAFRNQRLLSKPVGPQALIDALREMLARP